jgi:hypothetical protein
VKDLKDNLTLESLAGYNLTVHNKQGMFHRLYSNKYEDTQACLLELGLAHYGALRSMK